MNKKKREKLLEEIVKLNQEMGLYEPIEMTFYERAAWFINNYYETGMDRAHVYEWLKTQDLDNLIWYGEKVNIPKYK